jgi:hypothetical protein
VDPIRFSIQNPVKVAVGVILVVLFGMISLNAIPIQLTPDVERPVISVRTVWPGRSPEEVEKSILIEQEEKLKTLQGLSQMTSTAELGQAGITLEFNVGFPISRALQEVANRLDEVRSYPADVERPIIRASDSASDDAVAYCLLQAQDPDFEMARVFDYADRFVKPALERIPGVSEVGIYGGRKHQVQIQFDPTALAQRGISVMDLRSALQMDNVNESAGDLAHGRQDVRFRVLGQFDSLEPIRRTIVKVDAHGVPIRVEEIADVALCLEKKVNFAQSKGQTSMSLFVKRETGTNVLTVTEQVRRVVDELNAPGGILTAFENDRYGVRLRLVADDSYYIRRAVGLVRENLLLGGSLAVLVLLMFLRSPAVDGARGRVYVGSDDMHVYALAADDGRQLWRSDKLPGVSMRGYYPVVAPDGAVLVTVTPAASLDAIANVLLDMVKEVFGDFASWRHTQEENERLREANFELLKNPETYDRQLAYLRRRLQEEPGLQTFFVLDPATGSQRFTAPIVYSESMNGTAAPALISCVGMK